MYKQIRLFASDLDDTLLINGKLTQRGYASLCGLRKKGIIVVIASGRPFYSIQRIIPDECYDYACCYNGQDIYQAKTGKHFYSACLSLEEQSFLFPLIHQYNVFANASDDHRSYYFCDSRHLLFRCSYELASSAYNLIFRHHLHQKKILTDYSALMHFPCAKVCFGGMPHTLKSMQKQLDHQYTTFFVNPYWLEVQTKGISKGNALKKIMEMEDIHPSLAVAAGDGENDISLLQTCAYRVAMANAMPEVHKQANIHIGPFFTDSLPKWIQKNLLKQ